MSSKTFKLIPELVPGPLWGRSAHKMLANRVVWTKQIRGDAIASANNCCEVCGAADRGLICHDKWQYDDKQTTATLVGFEVHCRDCDAVIHAGRAIKTGPPEVQGILINHLSKVNRCTRQIAQRIFDVAWDQWRARSKKEWTIKVVLALVQRYPELAKLPDFDPPPAWP